MILKLSNDKCLYQDDVVDFLVKKDNEEFLRENLKGNLVLGLVILKEFKKITSDTVVWINKDKYWRYRVAEDENGVRTSF